MTHFFYAPRPKYVLSPSGIVHLATLEGDVCYCAKKITKKWITDDDDLIFRSWRKSANAEKKICAFCDEDRQNFYRHFAPFQNSTHLT